MDVEYIGLNVQNNWLNASPWTSRLPAIVLG